MDQTWKDCENVFESSFTLGPNLYANFIFNKTKMSEIATEIFMITEEHPNSIYEDLVLFDPMVCGQ